MSRPPPIWLPAVALSVLLPACREENTYVPPPPPEVGVALPVARAVTPYLEATGNTNPYNQVNLVARVEGFVQSIDYKDGAQVKAGEQLFLIEPAPYQAQLQQAQAALITAQAQKVYYDKQYARQAYLIKDNLATSQAQLDQAIQQAKTADADTQKQTAAVDLARINLSYTRVAAPFDGVATNHLVSVGALVGIGGATTLATLVQLDPIYVTFNMSEQDVQHVRDDMTARGLSVRDLGKVPVEIGLMTETGYPHRGVLDYASPQVDTSTGTLSVRAVLENKDHALLPGYFVRVRVPRPLELQQALLVPDAALGTAQAGRYLMVVNKDGVVEQRTVTTGVQEGTLRVIEAGLKPDDRVVVTGLARAMPGGKVVAKPAEMSGS